MKLEDVRRRHARYYAQIGARADSDLDSNWENVRVAAEHLADCVAGGQAATDDRNALSKLFSGGKDYLNERDPGLYDLVSTVLLKSADESKEKAKLLVDMAGVQTDRANYSYGLEMYLEGARECERQEPRDLRLQHQAFVKASRLAETLGNDELASDLLKRALDIAREQKLQKLVVDTLTDIARLSSKRKDYEQALTAYYRCLSIAREVGYSSVEVQLVLSVGEILLLQNSRRDAKGIYEEALTRARERGDHIGAMRIQEALKMAAKRTFICYSHEDRSFAERLANRLRHHGFDVWWDEWEIKVGELIVKRVGEGIASSSYLIALLSPSSVKSNWVQQELGSALMRQLAADREITILPALLVDCEIPELLRPIKWADFRKDFEIGLVELLAALTPAA